jgi:hypothetical protein
MFVYTFDFSLFLMNCLLYIDTLPNEDTITKAAKGKQFVIDYDLLCYKIVFQLAFKRDKEIFVSHIKCETNIINEREYTTVT